MIRVGINGFGRIGRRITRLCLLRSDIQIVAINDIANNEVLSHLLKYDSIHGTLPKLVSFNQNGIVIDSVEIPVLHYSHPSEIQWGKYDVDFVIECTGKFKTTEELTHHIENGAKRVILSVPPLDDRIKMVVLGVNDSIVENTDLIISNASCTTNNAAPMLKLMDDHFNIKQAYITTVHSYTTDQSLHDQPHKDLRRSRAAGQSIIPTTTGAAKALTKIFPHLINVIGGCGIRVPVPNGSLTDMTLNVKKEVSIEQVNSIFQKAAETDLKGILRYTADPIVSIDIVGDSHSCIFDSLMTSVIGNMVKIIGWYDNETGYSQRILDLICNLSKKSSLLSKK
ncbi:type I glyceraldehyde-3-phosphate dehydrogenase [Aegicerativicinus sediminis]|uniref:type I glyceraldehyde-3-phosphate dehydrogenase n=1 Tax=Aegicerativicinus sediminis TaxID=2893202 RepID=UPI001E43149C|nr:type I glyceraldehyde-3-phosphate dehydrogenase [Aegicerativicinus sediminis]